MRFGPGRRTESFQRGGFTIKGFYRYTILSWPAGVRATQVTPVWNQKTYYVYILASKRNGTLYVGVTNDLAFRVWQHKQGAVPGFTKKYGVKLLVYFETFDDIRDAIHRETRLKKYKREWKLNLIQNDNPDWRDLAADWYG